LCVAGKCQGEGQPCGDDYDCPGDELCNNGVCSGGVGAGDKPELTTVEQGGVAIKSGKTNSEGNIFFTDEQTGTNFYVKARDAATNSAIVGVKVTFADANFNTFNLEKEGYHVVFQTYDSVGQKADFLEDLAGMLEFMFELNPSDHTEFTLWDSFHEENNGKINAMEDYLSWAEDNYKYVRCMTKDEMEKSRDYAAEIISSASGWQVVSTAYEAAVKLDDWGLIDTLPEEIYHIYEPMLFTNPALAKGSSQQDEDCGDGIDNDCDGKVDSSDSDCGGADCSPEESYTACHEGDVWWFNACGLPSSLSEPCGGGTTCEGGMCVSGQPSCKVSNCVSADPPCVSGCIIEEGAWPHKCVEPCNDDSDCNPYSGYVCKGSTLAGEKRCVFPSCEDSSDCDAGLSCMHLNDLPDYIQSIPWTMGSSLICINVKCAD